MRGHWDKGPSTHQGEGPQEEPALLTPWSRTPASRRRETRFYQVSDLACGIGDTYSKQPSAITLTDPSSTLS